MMSIAAAMTHVNATAMRLSYPVRGLLFSAVILWVLSITVLLCVVVFDLTRAEGLHRLRLTVLTLLLVGIGLTIILLRFLGLALALLAVRLSRILFPSSFRMAFFTTLSGRLVTT